MKTIILILLFIINLCASTLQVEQKIYSLVLYGLFPNNSNIKIWCDIKEKNNIFKDINKIDIVQDKKDADILFIFNRYNVKTNKMVFVGKYRLLKEYSSNSLGGFYWQKGRPNLILLKKNIIKYKLNISNNLKEYEE